MIVRKALRFRETHAFDAKELLKISNLVSDFKSS